MASDDNRAVKKLAEEIVKAINLTVDKNNRSYVNNQINSVVRNTPAAASGGGGTFPGSINASQVKGLYNAVAGYIVNADAAAAGGDQVAAQIINTLNGIAQVQLSSATIDVAQIQHLYASYGEFINLVAEKATIQDVDVEKIRAEIADMGLANIGEADIDYAQIKDLTAGTAIIHEGVGGKLYIDRLAVTDANIVSLTTGELMLKNSDGQFVRLVVDEYGNVSGEVVEFEGDDILTGGSVSGDKLVENTITARELNVSQIFADQALVRAIKAANIDVDSLFASEGFITRLYTNTIQSPNAGTDIDISGNSQITLLNSRISLLVEDDSTSSEIRLTPGMIRAVSDVINVQASTIDLSANESIDIRARQVLEEELGYSIEIRSTSDVLSDLVVSATLTAVLYKGNKDITASTGASKFSWKRVSADAAGDTAWNNQHTGMKSVTITNADVLYGVTFQCIYTDNDTALAVGSKSILDISDNRTLDVSIGSNYPLVQMYDGNNDTYSPDWTQADLILTPSVIESGHEVVLSDSNLSINWYRKKSDGSRGPLASGESVINKTLHVSANVLLSISSGQIIYIVDASYTYSDGTVISSTNTIGFSLVKNGMDGGTGRSAVVLTLYAPYGTVFTNSEGTLTIQAAAYDGAEQIAPQDASFQWARFNAGQWTPITGETSDSLVVNGNDVTGVASYKCTMGYGGESYSGVVSLTDKTDNYQAVIESTGGTIFKNGVGNSTLTCRLFQNSNEQDTSGARFTYWWYKLDKDGNREDWNQYDSLGNIENDKVARRVGKSIQVVKDDIENKNTIICEVIDQTITVAADRLKTSGLITIIDMNDPIMSGTEPEADQVEIDTLWIDTSVTPNVLKRWNGAEWVIVSNVDEDEIEQQIHTVETTLEARISEINGEISLLATKEEVERVDDKVTANSEEIAEINVRYDDISLIVSKKSTNFRQVAEPDNPQVGDIWVQPVDTGEFIGTERQYQALGNVGDIAPTFAMDENGSLLYMYEDGVQPEDQSELKVDEDGDLAINTEYGDYTIINDRWNGRPTWKEIRGESIAMLDVSVNGIRGVVSSLEGDVSVLQQNADSVYVAVYGEDEQQATEVHFSPLALEAMAEDINLSANNTVRISAGEQIDSEAIKDIDLKSNKEFEFVMDEATKSNMWFEFSDEGLKTRRPEYIDDQGVVHLQSKWYTLVADDGFYIKNIDIEEPVGAFRRDTFEPRSMRLGNIITRTTAKGGWSWLVVKE